MENYPDFVPTAAEPALLCSLVQNDNFIQYVNKIDSFQNEVIYGIEQGALTNLY